MKLGDWRRGGSRHGATDLAAAVELQVLDGQLAVGTQLPAERELADALGVSRTLLGAALDRLRESGLVASRRGAGSWITAPGRDRDALPVENRGPDLIDFARASPPAVTGLAAAFDAARPRLADHLGLHGYSDLGLRSLRERIAERYTARGLPTTPDQVMITNGAHHGFVLILRMLAGPGDRVLVEQPTYPNSLAAVRAAHAIPVPVAVSDDGWDIPGIEAALRQAAPRLALSIVDFHNPTGLLLDAAGRERLGAAMSRARTPVVVDETLVDLDLSGGDRPPPLAKFAGDLAITVGSAAKSYWGGLRIGWLRASEELLGRLTAARYAIDLGSPVFEQLVLEELLARGEEVLAPRRADALAMREALTGALAEHCPEWTFRVPDGGLSVWCKLPEPMSTRLAVTASGYGVALAPAARFGVHGGLERWLRLPFASPPDRIAEGVRRVAAAADAVRGGPVPGELSVT